MKCCTDRKKKEGAIEFGANKPLLTDMFDATNGHGQWTGPREIVCFCHLLQVFWPHWSSNYCNWIPECYIYLELPGLMHEMQGSVRTVLSVIVIKVLIPWMLLVPFFYLVITSSNFYKLSCEENCFPFIIRIINRWAGSTVRESRTKRTYFIVTDFF